MWAADGEWHHVVRGHLEQLPGRIGRPLKWARVREVTRERDVKSVEDATMYNG